MPCLRHVDSVFLASLRFAALLYCWQFMTKAQKSHMRLILTLCLFGGVSMLNRFIVSPVDVPCTRGVEPLCGPHACSFQGSTHVAWQMPLQHCDQDYFTPGFQLHFFLFFLPIFALGMWRHALYLLLTGPILGRLLTDHHDEIPAIWCFFSIAQVFGPLFYGWYLNKEVEAETGKGKAGKSGKSKDAGETEDVVGGVTGMITKVLILAGFLALKRYVTDHIMVGADGVYKDRALGDGATADL